MGELENLKKSIKERKYNARNFMDYIRPVETRLKLDWLHDISDAELFRRNPPYYAGDKDEMIQSIVDYMYNHDHEHMYVISLNSAMQPINYHVASIGNVEASVVGIPEVFKPAILSNARFIIIAHNHPDILEAEPSLEDDELVKRLIVAGDFLEVQLLDSIIVTSSKAFYSYKVSGRFDEFERELFPNAKWEEVE